VQIIYYPHPTLRHVSKPVKRVDAELRRMIGQMLELMYEHKGVGLAANQVDLPYRLFVMNPTGDPKEEEQQYVFINPVLTRPKGSVEGEEGCLSIPRVYGDVIRAERITIDAYTLEGKQFKAEVQGMFARIVQHETDHLDGKLFVDRLGETGRMAVREGLEELEIEFASKRKSGEIPADESIAARLAELEKKRT